MKNKIKINYYLILSFISKGMSDRMPDSQPGGKSEYMSDKLSDRMPEYISDKISEYSQDMNKYIF